MVEDGPLSSTTEALDYVEIFPPVDLATCQALYGAVFKFPR